jgi:hypothetical protein
MKKLLILPLALAAALAGGAVKIVQDQCGPFTDVTPAFCPYILELYYLGITAGTSATTYSPDDPLTRGQAAVFISKGLNQSLARSSRHAALGQWWTTTPRYDFGLGVTTLGGFPYIPQSDGSDVWVPNINDSTVSRVRASDGKLLETWTGATNAVGALVAMGRVFATGGGFNATVYMIDPAQPAGAVTPVTTAVSGEPSGGVAFDGSRIWTANGGTGVSIVTPGPTLPWSTTEVSAGLGIVTGIIYDGTSIWVTGGTGLLKLDANGAILQTVAGAGGLFPVFDGANIWVPFFSSVAVVQASTGTLIATLVGNGLDEGYAAAFDGELVLVTNRAGNSVSLWKAADLTPLGSVSTGPNTSPNGVCSDGLNFWITLTGTSQLARF